MKLQLKNLNKSLESIINNTNTLQRNVEMQTSKKILKKIIETNVKKKNYYTLFNLNEKDEKKLIYKTNLIANLIGNQVAQNKKGEKNILVTPNVKKITKFKKTVKENLRYHQTNLGGSIHTDGPQIAIPPKFLIMTCLQNSKSGGESIVVNGEKIFKFVKANKHKFFKLLTNNVYFERRGFKQDQNYVFKKPIFKVRNKKFQYMRYLKDYIVSGYKIKETLIKNELDNAFNYLDNCLESKKFQKVYKMRKGDIIIINNHKMAHGRRKFSINKTNQRRILRVWVN